MTLKVVQEYPVIVDDSEFKELNIDYADIEI